MKQLVGLFIFVFTFAYQVSAHGFVCDEAFRKAYKAGDLSGSAMDKLFYFKNMRDDYLQELDGSADPDKLQCLSDLYQKAMKDSGTYWGRRKADSNCALDCQNEFAKRSADLYSLDRDFKKKVSQKVAAAKVKQTEAIQAACASKNSAANFQQVHDTMCCGTSKDHDGFVRGVYGDINYETCIGKIRETNQDILSVSGLGSCVGNIISEALKSLYDSVAFIFKTPFEIWSARDQIYQIMTNSQARQAFENRIYNAIKAFIVDRTQSMTSCLNSYEQSQFICKTTGQIIGLIATPKAMSVLFKVAKSGLSTATRAIGDLLEQYPKGQAILEQLDRAKALANRGLDAIKDLPGKIVDTISDTALGKSVRSMAAATKLAAAESAFGKAAAVAFKVSKQIIKKSGEKIATAGEEAEAIEGRAPPALEERVVVSDEAPALRDESPGIVAKFDENPTAKRIELQSERSVVERSSERIADRVDGGSAVQPERNIILDDGTTARSSANGNILATPPPGQLVSPPQLDPLYKTVKPMQVQAPRPVAVEEPRAPISDAKKPVLNKANGRTDAPIAQAQAPAPAPRAVFVPSEVPLAPIDSAPIARPAAATAQKGAARAAQGTEFSGNDSGLKILRGTRSFDEVVTEFPKLKSTEDAIGRHITLDGSEDSALSTGGKPFIKDVTDLEPKGSVIDRARTLDPKIRKTIVRVYNALSDPQVLTPYFKSLFKDAAVWMEKTGTARRIELLQEGLVSDRSVEVVVSQRLKEAGEDLTAIMREHPSDALTHLVQKDIVRNIVRDSMGEDSPQFWKFLESWQGKDWAKDLFNSDRSGNFSKPENLNNFIKKYIAGDDNKLVRRATADVAESSTPLKALATDETTKAARSAWATTQKYIQQYKLYREANQAKILSVFRRAMYPAIVSTGPTNLLKNNNETHLIDPSNAKALQNDGVPDYIINDLTSVHHSGPDVHLPPNVSSTTQILDMLNPDDIEHYQGKDFNKMFSRFSADRASDAFGLAKAVVRNSNRLVKDPTLRERLRKMAVAEESGIFSPSLNLADDDKLAALFKLNDKTLTTLASNRTFVDRASFKLSDEGKRSLHDVQTEYDRVLFPRGTEDVAFTGQLAEEFRSGVNDEITRAQAAWKPVTTLTGKRAPIYLGDTTEMSETSGGREYESWVTIPQLIRNVEQKGIAPIERSFRISGTVEAPTRSLVITNIPGRGTSMLQPVAGQTRSFMAAYIQAEKSAVEKSISGGMLKDPAALQAAKDRLAQINAGTWAPQNRPDGSLLFGPTYMTSEEFQSFVQQNLALLGYR